MHPAPAPSPPPVSTRLPASFCRMAGFFAVMALLWLPHGRRFDWTRWHLSADQNPAVAEARAWWSGRLDLPARLHDTAVDPRTGRVFNVYPPLLTLVSFLMLAPQTDPGSVEVLPPALVWAALAWPVPLVGFAAFAALAPRVRWTVFWTAAWLLGTALLPVAKLARDGQVYHLNHLLSQIGLLLIAADLLAWRRHWPAWVGLLVAAWSRQLTIFYAVPVLLAAWRNERPKPLAPGATPGRLGKNGRARNLIGAIVACALVAALPAALNRARFGSFLETGYRHVFADRDDDFARSARSGLFALHHIPRNAYYMNAAIPDISWQSGRPRLHPSVDGASIWFTTPLLAVVWLRVRRWWRLAPHRSLMLTSCLVALVLCGYHATGSVQPGYYRFALDFVPVWLAVGAATPAGGRWRTISIAAAGWGIAYFALL